MMSNIWVKPQPFAESHRYGTGQPHTHLVAGLQPRQLYPALCFRIHAELRDFFEDGLPLGAVWQRVCVGSSKSII